MNPIFNNYYKLPYINLDILIVSKILHIVYTLAYKIHPSGKFLTLAIKPNVNHKKDGQLVLSVLSGTVFILYDSARNLGYTKRWNIVIHRKP
jgi:hypothetical protein